MRRSWAEGHSAICCDWVLGWREKDDRKWKIQRQLTSPLKGESLVHWHKSMILKLKKKKCIWWSMNTKNYSTSRNISHPIQEFVPSDTIFILILRDIEDDCSFQLPVLGYLTPKKAWRISSKLFFYHSIYRLIMLLYTWRRFTHQISHFPLNSSSTCRMNREHSWMILQWVNNLWSAMQATLLWASH